MNCRYLPLGDSAFTVELPELSGAEGARHIQVIRTRVQDAIDQGVLSGIIDVISAVRSLTICIDPLKADISIIETNIKNIINGPIDKAATIGRQWSFPACYQGEYAPDLEEIATRAGITPDEVIKIHSAPIYDVLLIGFLPGFPFMSEINSILQFPRRKEPRLKVPAGSVAIANTQTAIYPWESPGGWHLLARCPVSLFDPAWDQPSLLSPGDRVKFDPVTINDYHQIEDDLKNKRIDPLSFLTLGNDE